MGTFVLALHSHLPYCRGAGRWPHGEEWIHEAVLGTYLPLLVLLHDLRDAGVAYRIVIGLTPILIEQLADRDINVRTLEYVDDQVLRAEKDVRRFTDAGDRRATLAEFYVGSYRRLREAYRTRFGRDLVGAFADLAKTGHVEILTSAATHGYLPLLDRPSVEAQLAIGRRSSRRLTGLDPTGIWLPECAYAPGLEKALAAHGITHFFTDAALLPGHARPAGDVRRRRGHSELGRWAPHEERVQVMDASTTSSDVDLLRPYYVGDSDVAAIARHDRVSSQVWSAVTGYPGDAQYREFHRKDTASGLRYWRVTSVHTGLGEKDEYSPDRAAERVRDHARHFVDVVQNELSGRSANGDPLLAVTFDSELFGHWWFEGVDWLGLVLRELTESDIRVATATEYLDREPPKGRIALSEGSWGKNNDHSTWLNEGTAWMWDELGRLAREMDGLRASPPRADAFRDRAARQAARELLLAQSSDWPFLVTTGQAADYAVERFRSHVHRFRRALALAHSGDAIEDETELRSLEHADNPFPDASLADFQT